MSASRVCPAMTTPRSEKSRVNTSGTAGVTDLPAAISAARWRACVRLRKSSCSEAALAGGVVESTPADAARTDHTTPRLMQRLRVIDSPLPCGRILSHRYMARVMDADMRPLTEIDLAHLQRPRAA